MCVRIGIRREDKGRWERRVPLVPAHVRQLAQQHAIEVWVQPSEQRIFCEDEYIQAGARISDDLSPCPVILGVKEIPAAAIIPEHTYVFFSHVVKGQPHNMPMLRRLLELGCSLIDYERVTDASGRRLIFFGRFAGIAGMIDTLWALGQRLAWEGIPNPFERVLPAWRYPDVAAAKAAVAEVGAQIARHGLPPQISPMVIGFAGYGNVFRGADEIVEMLSTREVTPADLPAMLSAAATQSVIHKVVFREEHTVEPIAPGERFALQDYYAHPQKYRSRFAGFLPYLTVLVNCIYWEPRYPRLVTLADLRGLYGTAETPRLRVIGDISCDIEGAIECTVKATDPGNPIFVYDPLTGQVTDGAAGRGPVVLAVDILPSELPSDASAHFSQALLPYLPALARADYRAPFDALELPPEIKRAVVVHRGALAPGYEYLEQHLACSPLP